MATMPVIIRQDAPAYLTAETPVPLWTGVNNADLVDYVLSLRQALGSCNADKAPTDSGLVRIARTEGLTEAQDIVDQIGIVHAGP